MEWNRVKTILIVLLLFVNVFLALNIYTQLSEKKQTEENSVIAASQLLQQRGIYVDSQKILSLSEEIRSYSVKRSVETEAAAADSLLGSPSVYEPGGGIYIYTSDLGEMNIRRGGTVDITMFGVSPQQNAQEYFSSLLEKAGFDISSAETEETDGAVAFTQTLKDLGVVKNACLKCTFSGGNALISGRWILSDDILVSDPAPSRAELMLALGTRMEQTSESVLSQISESFYISSSGMSSIEIIPVWIAEFSHSGLTFDLIAKQPVD